MFKNYGVLTTMFDEPMAQYPLTVHHRSVKPNPAIKTKIAAEYV